MKLRGVLLRILFYFYSPGAGLAMFLGISGILLGLIGVIISLIFLHAFWFWLVFILFLLIFLAGVAFLIFYYIFTKLVKNTENFIIEGINGI